ncbi:uncharacterized protein TNCV_4943361 [Trichonephila clavipes]|nr:uncharacterized protein TNCV_4943361 [Trichonephila clavipes]
MSSSPVPLKTRRVGKRCTLNLLRAQMSFRWCGVAVKRGDCHLRCRPRHLTMVRNYEVHRQKPSCSFTVRHRDPRNSSWQEARSTPVVGLVLEHHTGDSTNQLGEIPRRDDRWRHHLSPPPQLRHGAEGEGNILQSPALVIQPTRLRTH